MSHWPQWIEAILSSPSWLKWLGIGAAATGTALVVKSAVAGPTQPQAPYRSPIVAPPPFLFDPSTVAGFLDGVDVSAAQGSTIDWAKARDAAKLVFAIAKTSQGQPGLPYGYPDGSWAANRKGMRANLQFWGGYHYAILTRDPVASADGFCDALGEPDDQMLPPSIDLEWTYNNGTSPAANPFPKPSAAQVIDFMYAWELRVRQRTGRKSMAYTNAGFWNFIGTPIDPIQKAYALWNAVWTAAPAPTPVPGFSDYSIWQWSAEVGPLGKVPIPGIPGTSVDRDRFRGDVEDLRRFIAASKV